MSLKKRILHGAVVAAALAFAAAASAQTIVVSNFEERPADPNDLVAGTWYDWFTENGGASSIVDLTGLGGNLENAQPLPTGAALLTTGLSNGDRANVGVYDLLGHPADVFPSLNMSYWFHKAANPGQNLNAAAALKLEIYNPVCDDPASAGDCYGVLVYEPYVNGFGNFPPLDVWDEAVITPSSGGFWWTGGFGQPNQGGGPPYRTLSGWLGVMSSDFDDATVVTVQIGVGSYNQGQIAYFDDLAISHGFGAGLDVTYDFQASQGVGIDLRPGNSSNQVNPTSKQLVPIAILGSQAFDPVTDVDPESVVVRGASPIGTKSDTSDVNGDNYDDLTLYFRARSFAPPAPEECDDPDAMIELTGVTFDGQPFNGSDRVTWQGPSCGN